MKEFKMKIRLLTLIIGLIMADGAYAQNTSIKSKRKRGKTPSTSNSTSTESPSESSPAAEETPPTSNEDVTLGHSTDAPNKNNTPQKRNETTVATELNHKGPSWMFGLGITSIPETPFDTSLIETVLTLSQGTIDYKSADSDGTTKLKSKPQYGSVGTSFYGKTPSKKIAWGLGLEVDRLNLTFSGSIVSTEGQSAQATIKSKTDTPAMKTSISVQVRPGLWLGLSSRWEKIFYKKESKATVASTTIIDTFVTTRDEASTHSAGLEYISPTGQAGLEYTIETKRNVTTNSWFFPLRLSLTDSLFAGASLGSTQSDGMTDLSKTSGYNFEVEAGQQNTSSAYSISYAYTVEKSISAASMSLEKTKGATLACVFGPQKGTRFGFAFNYSIYKEVGDTSFEYNVTTPSLAFYIARVN